LLLERGFILTINIDYVGTGLAVIPT